MNGKLNRKIIIKGRIEVVTGLHIGGTDNILEIGGVKNSIIKIEKDGMHQPYVPGVLFER